MNEKIKNSSVEGLFEGVLKLNSVEECYKFFEDLCTVHEINSLAQRLEVAKMLKSRKTYTQIREKTGASSATISRVGRALNHGSEGYSLVLSRLEENKENEQKRRNTSNP